MEHSWLSGAERDAPLRRHRAQPALDRVWGGVGGQDHFANASFDRVIDGSVAQSRTHGGRAFGASLRDNHLADRTLEAHAPVGSFIRPLPHRRLGLYTLYFILYPSPAAPEVRVTRAWATRSSTQTR